MNEAQKREWFGLIGPIVQRLNVTGSVSSPADQFALQGFLFGISGVPGMGLDSYFEALHILFTEIVRQHGADRLSDFVTYQGAGKAGKQSSGIFRPLGDLNPGTLDKNLMELCDKVLQPLFPRDCSEEIYTWWWSLALRKNCRQDAAMEDDLVGLFAGAHVSRKRGSDLEPNPSAGDALASAFGSISLHKRGKRDGSTAPLDRDFAADDEDAQFGVDRQSSMEAQPPTPPKERPKLTARRRGAGPDPFSRGPGSS